MHLVGIDLVDLGIDDPFDMTLPHLRLEHALGIADTADAEVADVGLSRHEGHRNLVADPTLAQIGVHDHREFVGWPVTRGSLHGADHDRTGIFAKLLPPCVGARGVVHIADGVTVLFRAQSFDLIEGELGARGDHQVVVVEERTIPQLDAIAVRMYARRPGGAEGNAMFRQHRGKVDGDVVLGAPFDGHPGIGRRELEKRLVGNKSDAILPADRLLQVVGAGNAADTAAKDDDVGHIFLPCILQSVLLTVR